MLTSTWLKSLISIAIVEKRIRKDRFPQYSKKYVWFWSLLTEVTKCMFGTEDY
jgi:hypothetical protein